MTRLRYPKEKSTIIVKIAGKAATFFPFTHCPWTNVEQNLSVCACNYFISRPADRADLAKGKNVSFEH